LINLLLCAFLTNRISRSRDCWWFTQADHSCNQPCDISNSIDTGLGHHQQHEWQCSVFSRRRFSRGLDTRECVECQAVEVGRNRSGWR